jgi:hypothetical protein
MFHDLHKRTVLFVTLFSCLSLAPLAEALPSVVFPPDKTVSVPEGLKVHFGDVWILSTGTAIHVTEWFVSNWLNYTVDGSGTQQIYYSAQPEAVYIDGSHYGINNGWTYSSNIITVSTAASFVSIDWASSPSPTEPNPPQTGLTTFWVVFMTYDAAREKLPGVEIRVYTTVYQDYVGTYITDERGRADVFLAPASYDWTADYRGDKLTGSFLHVQSETVHIYFGTGETSVEGSGVWRIALILVVVAIGVVAILLIRGRM